MGLHELQIQKTSLQATRGQSDATSTSLASRTTQAIELVFSMDLRVIALLDGALSTEATTNKALVSMLKNLGLNLATLPNEFLHTLQASVIAEIKAR